MSRKLMSITIDGFTKRWAFEFEGDDEYLEEWRNDGLDVSEVIATIEFGENK